MKQVDQYAQAISLIPAIVDHYIDNKQGEAIKSHTTECREEALADSKEYIDLIDTTVRAIIKEEVKTQLPHILPQAVLEFATPVIEQNVTESLEVVFLVKYSSQPKSAYEAPTSLYEFELIKILMDKIEEHKSYLRANYKRELYDALVKSYNTKKDLFHMSAHAEEQSHTVDDSRVQQNQEFDMGNNDEQPDNEAASKRQTNLTIDERFDLNVALRMFNRRIVIQRRVEDLQLGVKSYQQKLNLTKQDTFRNKDRITAKKEME
nr:hypothetical protein [Tanacetum cinerariifolium]